MLTENVQHFIRMGVRFDLFMRNFEEIETRPYYKIHDPHWWECYYEIKALLNEYREELEDES